MFEIFVAIILIIFAIEIRNIINTLDIAIVVLIEIRQMLKSRGEEQE